MRKKHRLHRLTQRLNSLAEKVENDAQHDEKSRTKAIRAYSRRILNKKREKAYVVSTKSGSKLIGKPKKGAKIVHVDRRRRKDIIKNKKKRQGKKKFRRTRKHR